MLSIDSDSVEDRAAEPCFIFAAAAIADTAIATIPADGKRGVYSVGEPTENIKKARKEDWTTGTASGDGASVSDAA